MTLITIIIIINVIFHHRKMCKPEKIRSTCKFIGIILGIIILTIIILINIVIGFLYINQCPVQKWIWLYNIVAGCIGVFRIASWILAATTYEMYTKRLGWCFFILGLFILLFEIIWFIISISKIAPLWSQNIVQYTDSSLNTYCHPMLYHMMRVLLIIAAVSINLTGSNIAIQLVELIHS